MADRSVLDRPVWHALAGPQHALARGDALARRFDPAIGPFAAAADAGPAACAALARLVTAGDSVALLEADARHALPGLAIRSASPCEQFVLPAPPPPIAADPAMVRLTAADAPAMLALATLTRPGPFLAQTYRLGGFIGIRVDGRLIAMAGERMRPPGHCEVSGVCTHPDHGGRGYATALIRAVCAGIVARGETPLIHSYAANRGASALYRRLGFTLRRELMLTVLTRQ